MNVINLNSRIHNKYMFLEATGPLGPNFW